MKRGFWGLVLGLLLGSAWASPSRYAEQFEYAWRLVEEYYWDQSHHGVDWVAVGERYRDRLPEIKDWRGLDRLIEEMYGELRDDHSTYLSPDEARLLLSGAQCLPLPYREAWDRPSGRNTDSPSAEAANPVPTPLSEEPRETAFAAPQVSLRGGAVIVRLSNLIDPEAFSTLASAIRRYEAESFRKGSIKGYILDLRGNPGGLALRMAEVAGLFFRGVPWRIVSRNLGTLPQPTQPALGRANTQKPLVVLIDGQVNSAAEGLAGALKEAGRAFLVGQRTAGNTEVLIPYCFPDGAVAMVAAGVLAPLRGATWEGRGVEPDLPVQGAEAQLEAALRYLDGLSSRRYSLPAWIEKIRAGQRFRLELGVVR
ncbi:peptidase S41 [Allomeiothermus silvanus DSM 9946]|uniref:Peptidase S41 n=1 Tax=Allomeiothermus silvanus (strain ATCC 700542 / DSM 9946 / NBRC 106475 / NCIMB 13440 / VI-R2) TaxID=526227 RepID=D7BEK4_ALLS1|nr:S41 family peptidase [Allomeiothermus silvanus]ADH63247.1 peptidase S41 [Allomeiothermus silvanus DSM 9946]